MADSKDTTGRPGAGDQPAEQPRRQKSASDDAGDGGEALRRTRNVGLEKEQERLSDPAYHTPAEEEGGEPEPADALTEDEDAGASIERLKNPPQVEGPRERGNEMV